ncbi:MAG: TetR/AcrR family transcriptional regulator [Desulfatiglans sp.]|jgi:AcrR family transcriptional regulator|nr:TetR/AcrR family transcriptional regulator [Thermodesulfobacteriota bacterium]MEE4352481.1 TetR/AcrR family transcriptional regulator [Desulfatiglans sp.]
MTLRKGKIENQRFKDILDASAKVFRKKGYHHANISDIAKEVGLQKGSLYHYIRGKEELLYRIIMSALGLYVNLLRGIVVYGRPADEGIREAILAHMEPIDIQFDYIYVFLNEMQNLHEKYRKEADSELENYERLWIKMLEEGKASGLFRTDLDSKMTMLSIFGMCNWTVRWYTPEGKYSTTELAEQYAKNILEGIKA